MRVCVYGSSSPNTPKAYMDQAYKLGQLLAERGHVCVNGGGKTGCMGGCNEGCRDAKGKIVCVIHETFLVDKEEFQGADEMVVARGDSLAERKRLLMEGCDCIIALPGGAGTWDELWEAVCQVGLGFMRGVPLICVSVDGYYQPFHDMVKRGQQDMLVYKGMDDFLLFEKDAESALNSAESWHAQGKSKAARKLTARGKGDAWKYDRYKGAKSGFAAGVCVGVAAAAVALVLMRGR
uniref:Cytokinin riboside 5'-monophosphate phosphoribohydrolase n=1 Tax=Hemiselmis andersenii TaxID=464988 RepID=A0A6U2D5V3_HEMAN|mmetsp:Transcript_23478/g.54584  ORF Transcript_23478/g.54584 Transcript_23478/m.54584 type:complete len:236 (-) Transcript_23478:55-762(-)